MIPIPACNVLVAPRTGRLASSLPEDSVVSQGDVVAVLDAGSERVSLRAPAAGVVGGALVGVREALDSGDGVLWMRRAAAARPTSPVGRAAAARPTSPVGR